MHILHLKAQNAYGLPEDSYVADDINCGESLARGEGFVDRPHLNLRPFVPSEDWNGRKLLFCRGGGIGDILFTTPAIREIKKRWPQCEITFACFKHYMPVLENNPDVDHVVQHPMSVSEFTKFDGYFYLGDDMHDANAETHKVPAVDLILNLAGIETDDKELRYEIGFLEREAAWHRFPKGARKRIGVQMVASTASRTWPKSHVVDFSERAVKEGFEVIWFAIPGTTGLGKTKLPEHLISTEQCNPPLSLRETAALMSTCDSFLGLDSGLTHIAGAIGLTTLALYGSFPSNLRVSYAESIRAIDGEPLRPARGIVACNPCFHAYRPGAHLFPVGQPCSFTGKCEVLAKIEPEIVLKKLIRHMRKRGERVEPVPGESNGI